MFKLYNLFSFNNKYYLKIIIPKENTLFFSILINLIFYYLLFNLINSGDKYILYIFFLINKLFYYSIDYYIFIN